MYLDIGGSLSVRESAIVGIFDLDNTSVSARSRETLALAERNGWVVPCDGLPKAFVLTAEYGLIRIYLTEYSSITLEKRLKNKL
ncbi:MAG: DUF370 domain-containing protein [Firmicutes bacterium]|nr:DUF370 domain-containing protein [Bacillota bacterium]